MANNNVKNVINSKNNQLLQTMNNIVATTALANSYGLGKYLPGFYTPPLIFATNVETIKRKVDDVNYLYFNYTFYYLDNVGDSNSQDKLFEVINMIVDDYGEYLQLSGAEIPSTSEILPYKGAKALNFILQYNLDAMNLPADDCCDILLAEGPQGISGSSGSSGTSGTSGIDGNNGANGDSAGLTLYLNISEDQPPYMEISGIPIVSAEQTVGDTVDKTINISPATAKVIASFLTPPNTPGNSIIAPGRWVFYTYVTSVPTEASPTNNAYVGYRIYKYDTLGVKTLLKETTFRAITDVAFPDPDLNVITLVFPVTPLDPTDRLLFEYCAYTDSDSNKMITFYSEGEDNYSFIQTSLNFVSGTSGTSGSAGTSGSSGTAGSSGIDGTSGSAGTSGSSGTAGSSGIDGLNGTSGSSGINGTFGSSGTSGSSGISGTFGSSGTSGSSSSSGSSGVNGTSGSSGANGTSGSSGTNGLGVAGAAFGITIDGAGELPTTGSVGYVRVPYNCTINTWSMAANATGSAVVDVKRSGTSIVGTGNKPTLSSGQFALTAVSGWTSISVAANDLIEFNLDSVATLTRLNLSIIVTRS